LGARGVESMGVSVLIRKVTLAALLAALVGGSVAIPASSKTGPVASASKCKKAKKGKHKKKKRKCGGSSPSAATLPGQATHPTATSPPPPPPAPGMSGVSLNENPVLAGRSTSGLLTISGAAPSGGQAVTLQSSDPTRVAVPSSVVVAAGQTTAGFPVDTTVGSTVTTTVTASIGSSNASAQFKVVSHPSVASVALQRQCFTLGSFSSNRVTLDVPAPADTDVDLQSSDPLSLSVPSTVTVPSGSSSALFGVTALLPSSPVTVTATLGASSAEDAAPVNASPDPQVASLALSPNSVTVGGTSTATVTLDCEAGPTGAQVALSSSGPPDVSFPAMVTVPQDQLSTTFQITTTGATAGDEVITATRGSSQQQATLHVNNLGT
jgi:hypothetical protein